jgi:hypothetical protein
MHPPSLVSGPGKALVEDVQVNEPVSVQKLSVRLDVAGTPVFSLDNGHTIPKVSGIAPSALGERASFWIDVMVLTRCTPHSAPAVLKIATPLVALPIYGFSTWVDVEASTYGLNGRPALVEAKCALKAVIVDRPSGHIDVRSAACFQCRGQTGFMEFEHLLEAGAVDRLTI